MKPLMTQIRFEWAQLVAGSKLGSLVLFSAASTFSVYLALGTLGRDLSAALWSILFWVIQIFSAIQIAERMYGADFQAQRMFYYQNTTASRALFAKLVVQSGLQFGLAVVSLCLFLLLFGTEVESLGQLCLSALCGSLALTALYQVVGAIASATSHPARYTAVLGTPVSIPVLLESIRASKRAVDGLELSLNTFSTLPAFALVAVGIAVLLYPQIWHE